MSTGSKPENISSAADLLSRYPASGRHFRTNLPLYGAEHVLHFAAECSRASAERIKIAIAAEFINPDDKEKIISIDVRSVLKGIAQG